MQKSYAYLKKLTPLIALSALTSLIIAVLSLSIWKENRFFDNLQPYVNEIYLWAFIFLAATIGGAIFFAQDRSDVKMAAIRYSLATLLIPEIILLWSMQNQARFHPLVPLLSALYILCLGIFLADKLLPAKQIVSDPIITDAVKPRPEKKYLFATIGFVVLLVYGFLGIRNIEKFAAVDEALWTFDRIPNFWRDIGEYDWRNARVSDKPGFPVAVVSGTSLFFESNPKRFKDMDANRPGWEAIDFENFNKIFRIPLFALTIILLPLFYFATKKLLGRNTAIIFFILLASSPLILGNSRIINPDSILWIFVPLSIIYFLTFLEKEKPSQLYLSGLFLGLAILTKYTANILFPFFLALIPFYYIFNDYSLSFRDYLKKSFRAYATLIIISLTAFFTLYPAVWEKPDRVFLGTIFSQAFISIWPLFAGLLILILFDLAVFQARFFSAIIDFLKKFRAQLSVLIMGVFIASITLVIFNIYLKKLFDFEKILASPKSSHVFAGYPGIFLANFYPLVFGISALTITAIFIFAWKILSGKNILTTKHRATLALTLFILIFYLGSSVTHVALIIRYQIVIFPVIFLIAAIALWDALEKIKSALWKNILLVALAGISLLDLALSAPQFMSYASFLLPKAHYLDIKDMGTGSYEAAAYLNTLPNAKSLKIWTDKNGVCTFFEGECFTTLDFKFLNESDLDFFVLSSGRASRSKVMTNQKTLYGEKISHWYESEKYLWKIDLGNRPNNFVKIVPVEKK